MPNFGEPFSEDVVRQICSDRISESQILDFKRDVPSSSDKDKAEFLKDVCAFANAGGGAIIFGIQEKDGSADAVVPIKRESADEAQRRLGQMLDAGIEPRLSGLKFDVAEVDDGYILRVLIAPSFGKPYRCHYNGHSKFVIRQNTHTTELTYVQLRDAFDQSSSLFIQARADWQSRVGKILAGETWKPMPAEPLAVVKLTSLAGISGDVGIDVHNVHENFGGFMFPDWGGASRTFNLDGVVVYPGSYEPLGAYTQIYRSGAIESVRVIGHHFTEEQVIPSTTVSTFIRDAIIKFTSRAKENGIYGPVVVNAAVLATTGYKLGVGGNSVFSRNYSSDRPNIILPEFVIEQIANFDDFDSITRPLLDILWQAFGVDRCYEYSKEGEWSPRC